MQASFWAGVQKAFWTPWWSPTADILFPWIWKPQIAKQMTSRMLLLFLFRFCLIHEQIKGLLMEWEIKISITFTVAANSLKTITKTDNLGHGANKTRC